MKLSEKSILLITIFLCGCLIYMIRSVMTPFIFSLVAAYFLNPLVNLLDKKFKLSRLASTSLIMVLFLTIIIVLAVTLLPVLCDQLISLASSLPSYLQTLAQDLYPKIVANLNKAGMNLNPDISHLLQDERMNSQFVDVAKSVLNNAINSSATVINLLSLIFIMPILIFYLLKDWNHLVDHINEYLPHGISTTTRKIAGDIDKSMSAYIRGQFNVCMILAAFYSISLGISGLNFGFLIGFCTGLLIFIPYIGMLCGIITATIVGLVQWGFNPTYVIIITSIFVVGQILESNFLTPKLIGDRIGLHPVWIIFGLFVFGALLGIIGVLFAVPLTAISGVFVKHFLFEYKKRLSHG